MVDCVKIDKKGRIVIPRDILNYLNISVNSYVSVLKGESHIVIQKINKQKKLICGLDDFEAILKDALKRIEKSQKQLPREFELKDILGIDYWLSLKKGIQLNLGKVILAMCNNKEILKIIPKRKKRSDNHQLYILNMEIK